MHKRMFGTLLTTVLMLGSSLLGTSHANIPGSAGSIVGSGALSCKALIKFPTPPGGVKVPTTCNGIVNGTVKGIRPDRTQKDLVLAPSTDKALWLASKVAVPPFGAKGKLNFNANAWYQELAEPGGEPIAGLANGTFEGYGPAFDDKDFLDNPKGTGYLRGCFEYTRVVVVAAVTVSPPTKKTDGSKCAVTKAGMNNNKLRVGNGAKGDPDSTDQIWCDKLLGRESGAGIFTFVPKSNPTPNVLFEVWITGEFNVLCVTP